MKFDLRLPLLLALLSPGFGPAAAQGVSCFPEREADAAESPEYALVESGNNWLFSQNPASIGVVTMPDIGTAQLNAGHLGGKLHRAMESGAANDWGFGANSYRSLKGLNLWGDFAFTQRRHIGRAWSDNFDPYNGNPFQAGCDLKGEYAEQNFDFKVKASSHRLFRRLWLGLGFDYTIGDLSRLQDPRSRVQVIDLNIRPGVIVALGDAHKIGADFRYRYRKEKNNSYVSKAQDSKEYLLYLQEGLGVYSALYSSNFDRRVKGNYYGGEVQYEFAGRRFSLLATAGMLVRDDRIEDRNRACPGDYASDRFEASLRAKWQDEAALQLLTAGFSNTKGRADKIFQELVTSTDPGSGVTTSHYETLFSSRAYTDYETRAGAEWSYSRLGGPGYRWFVGAGADYLDLENSYVFYTPASKMTVRSAGFTLRGGLRLLARNGHRLFAGLSAGYRFNLDGSCFMSDELEGEVIRLNVVEPDYRMLTVDSFRAGLDLKYLFPLAKRIDGFVSVYGQQAAAVSDGSLKRGYAGIAIGILTQFGR